MDEAARWLERATGLHPGVDCDVVAIVPNDQIVQWNQQNYPPGTTWVDLTAILEGRDSSLPSPVQEGNRDTSQERPPTQ